MKGDSNEIFKHILEWNKRIASRLELSSGTTVPLYSHELAEQIRSNRPRDCSPLVAGFSPYIRVLNQPVIVSKSATYANETQECGKEYGAI
jgi:hypothetical protein